MRNSFWRGFTKIGGIAAWMVAGILLAAIIFISSDHQVGVLFQDNFLVLLTKLHAGASGLGLESLEGLALLDLIIVILIGIMTLALYPALKQVNKVWAIIAVILPFVGLTLYISTQDIGRSGVMGTGLLISVILLRSEHISKIHAFTGILANTALLIGDVGIAFDFSPTLAIIMGIGYMLFIIWSFLMGRKLLQL